MSRERIRPMEFNNDYKQLIKAGYEYVEGTLVPQPISRPQFTLNQLRNAIPPHCFKRDIMKSFGYLSFDLVIISSLLFCVYNLIEQWSLPLYCQLIGYSLYWFLQGSFLFGLWIIAHECGHSAFSEIDAVNDIIGFIIHSALLVPYYSWKITHHKHHANTGSCENDVTFVPYTKKEIESTWSDVLEDSPLYQVYRTVKLLIVGMPSFLVLNASGPRKYENRPKSHFNPNADFFSAKQRPLIVLSDIGFTMAVVTIGYYISIYGFPIVFRLYIIPYLIMNAYLVAVTFLHHTDTYIPHFRQDEWSWLRGALCTVDRSYGKFLDMVFHHLTDSHVCHHIFPKMPFYNCVEATEAIRPILGKYYLKDHTPFYVALWRAVNHCKYVQNDGKVVFYKK